MLDWLLCGLVSVVGWVLCRLPVGLCVRLGEALGQLGFWLQPKRARVGSLNVKAAYGERISPRQARRIVRQVFRNMGAGLIEMLRLPVIDAAYMERYIKVAGLEHLDRAVASGRPIVVLTGHFGNWELCSIAAALRGHSVVALARAQNTFPKLYRLLVSYRESKGCRIVHKGGAMRQLLKALDRRELVGIVGDQATRQGVFIEFLGRPALFATGPFKLARARQALILPVFIHRVKGPHHRLVVEPPIDLPRNGKPEAIVRTGIEQFANMLAEHIESDPAQWLWLHKRWKHTPVRRVLVLSDGKLGHLKQSLTVLQAFNEHAAVVHEQVVEVRYRHRAGRWLATLWAWLMPRGWGGLTVLRWALEPSCAETLTRTFADVVISCGASTAPVNVLLSAENRARSIVVMNPTPIPLRRFSLAFVPVHDRLPPRANVVPTLGALTGVKNGHLLEARERLRAHPRFRSDEPHTPARAVLAVLFGGETSEYRVTEEFAASVMQDVLAACEDTDSACVVTTSRRTTPAVERWLTDHVAAHPRCRLLLLASRDQLDGTLEGMLGWAGAVVVTGESISMVSEACASGRPVVVVEPPLRHPRSARPTKAQHHLSSLAREGYLHRAALPGLGQAIRLALTEGRPLQRLDTYATVQDAVKRLL